MDLYTIVCMKIDFLCVKFFSQPLKKRAPILLKIRDISSNYVKATTNLKFHKKFRFVMTRHQNVRKRK